MAGKKRSSLTRAVMYFMYGALVALVILAAVRHDMLLDWLRSKPSDEPHPPAHHALEAPELDIESPHELPIATLAKKAKKAKKSTAAPHDEEADISHHENCDSANHENPDAEEAAGSSKTIAKLHTDEGIIVFELLPNDAPKSVALFVKNSQTGVYNGSCFYRYERGFVLQGGLHCAKRPKGSKSSHATVPLEYKIPNRKMTVALARAGGDTHSGGAEFFINLRDNSGSLSRKKKGGYAVFAMVREDDDVSADTIKKMKQLPTQKRGLTYFKSPQPMIKWIEIVH